MVQASHAGPFPHPVLEAEELPFPSWGGKRPGSGKPRRGGLAISVYGSKRVEVKHGVTSALSVPGLGARGKAPGGHPSCVRSHQAQGEAAPGCFLDSGHRKGGDLGQRRCATHRLLKTADLPTTCSSDSQLLDYKSFS